MMMSPTSTPVAATSLSVPSIGSTTWANWGARSRRAVSSLVARVDAYFSSAWPPLIISITTTAAHTSPTAIVLRIAATASTSRPQLPDRRVVSMPADSIATTTRANAVIRSDAAPARPATVSSRAMTAHPIVAATSGYRRMSPVARLTDGAVTEARRRERRPRVSAPPSPDGTPRARRDHARPRQAGCPSPGSSPHPSAVSSPARAASGRSSSTPLR